MRKFSGLIGCFTILALIACGARQDITMFECNQNSQIVFHGGTILVSPTEEAEAIFICDDAIAAIGMLADFKSLGDSVTYVDLDGRALLPGFVDSHVHVRELGMDAVKADLVGVKTVSEIVDRLKLFFPNPVAGEWLIGQGWDEGKFASWGYPDRALLDKAFPNNPVRLESLHGFGGFYNGKALEVAGIDAQTPDPDGGSILRRDNGEPTGVMLALGQALVDKHVPEVSLAQTQKAILAGLNILATQGVTSIHEAGMESMDIEAFSALADRGELPIRVYGMLNGNNQDLMGHWFERGILDDPKDFFDIRSIKVFYDGSLGSRTALLAAPYFDKPQAQVAAERISRSDMKSLGERAARGQFQMAVHAIGDLGNDVTLSQFENALSDFPNFDHRWRIEHAQVVLPDFYQRMATQNVIASMQPSHAVGDSLWAEDRLGPDRIKNAYAWRQILSAGGTLVFNSDLPGEPWKPMETLYFAVTRKNLMGVPDGGWYSNESVTRQEGLKAMTMAGAYAAFQEEKLGSLAPGKWADLVILSENPLIAELDAIKDIEIEQVWVAGQKIR